MTGTLLGLVFTRDGGGVQAVIGEIAIASEQQSRGVEEVNASLDNMNAVTQTNAAGSDQSTAAANQLMSEAADLPELVGSFHFISEGGAA